MVKTIVFVIIILSLFFLPRWSMSDFHQTLHTCTRSSP